MKIEVQDEFVGDVTLTDVSALFARTVKRMGAEATLHDLANPEGRGYKRIHLKIELELDPK